MMGWLKIWFTTMKIRVGVNFFLVTISTYDLCDYN